MASADQSSPVTPAEAGSTSVKPAEAAPSPSRQTIPLPPPSPERVVGRHRLLDGILVAIVLLFAFLCALFPARNNDFFLHAATGRLIAQWHYQIGVDPFAFTTQGAYWVNPNWLYDLVLYLLYAGVPYGGTILVILKALLIAALAEVMLRASRDPGRRLWIPACCVALAVLTISPRMWLQPTCISFFLLGLTYWLLRRPGQLRAKAELLKTAPPQRPFLSYWLIPPLCLLWANLDYWFLLGPATVALYLIGDVVHGWFDDAKRPTAAPGERRTLFLVLLASVAACVINPHHIWAFTPPPHLGLNGATDALRADDQFEAIFLSPIETTQKGTWWYFNPYAGLNVAGLAFFPLVLLGLVSFAAAQWVGRWRWERAFVWTAFLALALWRASTIPFFAVVAGPIAALNWLDFAAARFSAAPWVEGRAGTWAMGGRVLTLAAGILLLVAAWPGWLQAVQPPPREWRGVGWTVEPDAALKSVAERIKDWRDKGMVEPDARWFHTAPQVLPYLAWYCPGERGFLDNQRLGLYDRPAPDYTAIRRSLAAAGGDADKQDPAWRRLLKKNGVHFLIWYESKPFPPAPTSPLGTLLASSWDRPPSEGDPGVRAEWPLLYRNGSAAVFGWRDPAQKDDRFALLKMDADREAFGPDAVPAPPGGAPDAPEASEWWSQLWAPQKPRSPDGDAAAVQWERFAALQPVWRARNEAKWKQFAEEGRGFLRALAATESVGLADGWLGEMLPDGVKRTPGLVRDPPPMPAPFPANQDEAMRLAQARELFDFGPPATLILGIRDARRALAASADDPLAYEILARCYFLLTEQTRAGSREAAVHYKPLPAPFPSMLRRVQIATALRRALMLDPDNLDLEAMCYEFYKRAGFFDTAIGHGQRRLELMREKTRPAKEIKEAADELESLQKLVARSNDAFLLNGANKPVLEKVKIALGQHLGQAALDELQKVDWEKDFKKDDPNKALGVQREMSLMVQTGRADEVEKALIADQETLQKYMGLDPDVGLPAYEWLRVETAAAEGNYAEADKWLEEMQNSLRGPNPVLLGMLEQMQVLGQDAEKLPDEALATRPLTKALVEFLILRAAQQASSPVCLPTQLLIDDMRWRITLIGANDIIGELLGRDGDLEVMRGWLALEAGRNREARDHFESARRLAPADQVPFRAGPLADLGLEWLGQAK